MYDGYSKNEILAEWIVRGLEDSTAPGNCTWGDAYPNAHDELFKFSQDMILDVLNRVRAFERLSKNDALDLAQRTLRYPNPRVS